MSQETLTIVLVGIVIVAVAAAAWGLSRRLRTRRLRARFGPEYEGVLQRLGDRHRAEKELAARQTRVQKLALRTLTAEEKARFGEDWKATQARFVDDPESAVADANHLVKEVMQARGYPVADFEQRAADLSVSYPRLVSGYRSAREIVSRLGEGKAGTEDLRQAVLQYRGLLEELLETRQVVKVAS